MRRRIRSAAFPVHRHALPQLVVDGLLVALAYFLAFWLRFEGGFPKRCGHLLGDTIRSGVVATLVALGAFGQYQRLWRFIGQRDYEAVLKAVFVATVVVVGAFALLHPVQWPTTIRVPGIQHAHPATSRPGPIQPVALPASVIATFFLLTLALLIGARFAVQLIVEGRIRTLGAGKGGREVLIVGGGEGGRLVVRELLRNPGLGLTPVGFLDDDPRKGGIQDEHGLQD